MDGQNMIHTDAAIGTVSDLVSADLGNLDAGKNGSGSKDASQPSTTMEPFTHAADSQPIRDEKMEVLSTCALLTAPIHVQLQY
jgi:hypothetical protein